MHISEGLLPLAHAAAWSAAAVPFLTVAGRRIATAGRDDAHRRSLVGMSTAIVFAVTLMPLPVPGIGVSSHMCATPVMALLLGPELIALPAAVTLLLQALFFAHGGLTTLGANVITLGVCGPWVGWALARGFRSIGVPVALAVGLACGLADVAVYLVDSGIVAGAIAPKGEFRHVALTMLAALAVPQGILAVVEAFASAAFFAAFERRRTDLVPAWLRTGARTAGPSLAGLAAVAVVLLSPAARAAEPAPGLDEVVFDATAARSGRPPAAPLIDLGGAEHSAMLLAFFAMGLIAGQGWNKVTTLPRPNSILRSALQGARADARQEPI